MRDKHAIKIMTKDIKINLENENQIIKFVQMNSKSSCQVDVRSGHSYIDGKSIIGLLSLNLLKPLYVSVIGDSNKITDLIDGYQEYNLVAG
ncbi:hypothetical protein [Butyrivibrio sp. WCE2006]|uniref:hypothetical protein n=1 Tax=Butyrivibrio sp. WCE2006 TaxID=1410611 RepID=UPI0012DE960F|nr:hypothetical protein [Butyrivibrio sp. WCE2006]